MTDADSGEPVAGATVAAEARTEDARLRGTATDSSGAFRLSVPAGTYRVTWSAVGYASEQRTVDLEQGETAEVSIALALSPYTLNEIVVEREGGQAASATTTVQRIEAAAIEQQNAADVSELAPLIPASHVQTNSRGQTIIYFRNAGDRQVGQFFDGALLNIPWDNRVDISLIPASVVGNVTVAKGVPSVRYGANVLGGAINFESRTLDRRGRTTEARVEVGTAEQRRGSVTHLGRTRQWDYATAVQYSERGNLPLAGGVNLANNQPGSSRRVNTDRRLASVFARAGRRFDSGAQLAVTGMHVDAEQGVAPEGNVSDDQTRYWRYPLWRKSVVIASGQAPVGDRTEIRGAAWGSRFAQDIAQYRSIDYDALNEVQEDRDLTAGLRLIAEQDLGASQIRLALNGLTTRHDQTNIPSGSATAVSEEAYRQHIFSTGLEFETEVHPRVRLTAGASIDGTATPETGAFPERDPFYAWGATSGVRVDLGGGWNARGTVGRKSRFPTMRELFGAALNKFVPNPNLRPVTAWIGEAGIEHRAEQWSVGATAFLNRVYDTIDKRTFQEGPNAGKEQRINLAGSRVWGIETTVLARPTDRLRIDGHLTWSRPRGYQGDRTVRLDEKPAWMGTGTVSYELPFGASVLGQARYTGGVYARNENNAFIRLPEALILDAKVSYPIDPPGEWDGSVFARVDNLTDEARFIGLGLPGPGRSIRAGIEVSF